MCSSMAIAALECVHASTQKDNFHYTYIRTFPYSGGDELSERDVFDRLFEAAPEKLGAVKTVNDIHARSTLYNAM